MKQPRHAQQKSFMLDGETITLSEDEYHTLERVDGAAIEVKNVKEFAVLRRKGLVKERFQDRGDWKVAVVRLTERGDQVLRRGFHAV